jgi:hypothetical protein
LPDGIFSNQNPNLGKFWRDLQWKMLVYFTSILFILRPFGLLCGHSVYFMVIWYILSRFGMLYQEKYGNPGFDRNFSREVWIEKRVGKLARYS